MNSKNCHKYPPTAFIIVTFNEKKCTSRLIDSLLAWHVSPEKLRIIVVDNCSTDETYAALRAKYESSSIVDIIHAENNGGYGAGNNFGAKYAIKKYGIEYIVISNPDILIEKEDFYNLFDAFQYPNVAVSTATMKNADGTYLVRSISIPSYRDDLLACFGAGSKNPCKVDYLDGKNEYILSDFIPGCFFVIRSSVFCEIDGFDENVFLFCEERMIGKKLIDSGYKQVICSNAFFLHDHSVTINKAFKTIKVNHLIFKSRLYYNKAYRKVDAGRYCVLWICSNLYILGLITRLLLYKIKRKFNG